MAGAEWAFCIAMGTLAYLALLALRLVRAIWTGDSPRITGASVTVAFVLIALSVLSIPRSDEQLTLVAGVAGSAPAAAEASPLSSIQVSGSRVRLSGPRIDDASGIWAIVEDPRTGTIWLQGPATQDSAAWKLDLVVGPEVPTAGRSLAYRVSLLKVNTELHQIWLAGATQGVLSLSTLPPGQTRLAGDYQVLVGG